MKRPNMNAEPMIIEGHKAWHIGRTVDGKEVYQLEKGFCHLKNGVVEFGEAVDDEGNFVKPVKEKPAAKKPKKGKE